MITVVSTFILVAGSFHGGWSWRRTARLLRARGHEVYAPSLTGMGERAHLTTPDGIGLATHVDDVLAVVDAEELTDVVLVGHSYAGVVVGSVVDRRPEPFRRVVYLDALVPEDGRSVIDLLGPAGGSFLDRADEEAGVIPLDEESLDRWGLVRPADRDWVRRRASPQPLATFTDAAAMSRAVEASGVPVTYVYCTVKPRVDLFTAIAERTKADPAWDHVALAGPHDCMITHPVETADVLAAL
jgi:pimeloyl-ACP methyl ester carboxylesterase